MQICQWQAALHSTDRVPALTSLDIGGNPLRDEGLESMLLQLNHFDSITRLCLRDNKLTVMGMLPHESTPSSWIRTANKALENAKLA